MADLLDGAGNFGPITNVIRCVDIGKPFSNVFLLHHVFLTTYLAI